MYELISSDSSFLYFFVFVTTVLPIPFTFYCIISVDDISGMCLVDNKPIYLPIIIQQIVTLSKYGHDALDICHP